MGYGPWACQERSTSEPIRAERDAMVSLPMPTLVTILFAALAARAILPRE